MGQTRASASYTLWDAVQELERQAAGLCPPTRQRQCGSDCCRALENTGGRVVAVTLPDLIALAGYLERPRNFASLRGAVEQTVERYCSLSPFTGTYMLTGEGHGDVGAHGKATSCPFLSLDGRCQVYTVRPVLCRIFFHCDWVADRLSWDARLDAQVTNRILSLAANMGALWEGHSGLVWRQPWRYDAISLEEG
ncbi:MAG: hypothetical protein HPY83_12550 [Anaerolineae bacterium]|nr:hypothetical protein [Anaerolineae bacterium]